MTTYLFNSETGKSPHRRWWRIDLGDRQRAVCYLDLLELLIGKNRKIISNEMSRLGKSPGSIEDVASYILHYND